jgi:Transglycosylase SLT domain
MLSFGDRAVKLGAMKALQATCIVGAITFTGVIHQVGGNTPGATVPDAMPEAAVSVETPGVPALSAAVPEASAAGSGLSLMPQAEIGNDTFEARWMALGHHDASQPTPTTHDASDDASNPALVTQDFRYLIYYVSSELPPAEKPAAIVLRSLKDTPVGTPVEEIKRASDAFGLDFNFMKAVAKIESGFNPKQRTGSYIGLFQLSEYEFNKFGSGQIRDPRDNAVAAAYKFITEGILFEWVTHKKPTLSDLYLIHQQGWEGAAEHISQPDRIAWKSMCATSEGMEKGENTRGNRSIS